MFLFTLLKPYWLFLSHKHTVLFHAVSGPLHLLIPLLGTLFLQNMSWFLSHFHFTFSSDVIISERLFSGYVFEVGHPPRPSIPLSCFIYFTALSLWNYLIYLCMSLLCSLFTRSMWTSWSQDYSLPWACWVPVSLRAPSGPQHGSVKYINYLGRPIHTEPISRP